MSTERDALYGMSRVKCTVTVIPKPLTRTWVSAGMFPVVAERTWKIATAVKKPILSAMTSEHATDSRLGRFGLARRKFARSYALFRFRLTNVRTGAIIYLTKQVMDSALGTAQPAIELQ